MLYSSSVVSKHQLEQLNQWWQQEDKTLNFGPTLDWHYECPLKWREGPMPFRGWLAARSRDWPGKRLLTVLFHNIERRETDNKAERKSRAHHRMLSNLKDIDLVSLNGVKVVVHCQEDQERSKHGDGGEEMPNVVVIKEWKQDTVSVVFTRLCGSFLLQEMNITVNGRLCITNTMKLYNCKWPPCVDDYVCGFLTCQVLRPWKKKYSARPHTTAVKRIHTSARHRILSPLRSLTHTKNALETNKISI